MSASGPHRPRRVLVAGATGATGRTLLALPEARGLDLVPHVRPATARERGAPPGALVLDLEDGAALADALQGFTTVVQLIGTMRRRFSRGDTYETSDVGTTRALVSAARAAGVDHLVLLSSVGAGRPFGAYLEAKARAEALVAGSGLDFTIFRPSAFEGAGHRPVPGLAVATRVLGLDRLRPIAVDTLARAILHVAITRDPPCAVLEGASLWFVVDDAAKAAARRLAAGTGPG
jgi:nucleoside-diphosphate-sugar epimerase